ncbi:MAG TPA: ATP-binding protein, partial [Thermoanaerobaculia bacterium]|nr:ATP-binding protein [Thermoanaerobaculia bacterium]
RVYTLGTAELLRQLQLITDSLPVLVAYIDRDCRYRFINRHYETWFGRPLHEFAGRPVSELLGVEAYERVRDQIDAALAGHQVTYERWLPYRDAGEHFVHATYMPHVHAGEVQGFVSFVEDVSERKRAEEALQLLSDAGEKLSESLDFETTLDNAARLAVPALADWSMIDLVQEGGDCRRVVSLHADPARQPLMEELKRHPLPRDSGSRLMQVLETGEPVLTSDLTPERVEAELRSDDHARIIRQLAPRSSLAVPLVARGRTLGVWSFLYAESGRRYREEDLRVALELARRAAVALDNSRLYRELEAANRAKDHFLATLSHELRTPLTPVLAIASRLEVDGRLLPEVREGIDVIRRNVELEARLIDDLLDLTRVTRGKLELHCELVDVRQVIRQALETCGERQLMGRRVELDLASEEHRVWGDPSRLTQVFWNLLNNALKFTPEGGTVAVRSSRQGPSAQGTLAVEVADSGIGIEPEALAHIFNAFDQGRAGITRRFGGLGLGLAISRAIVELHGGRLAGASEGRDRGAVFTVELPLVSELPAGVEAVGEVLIPSLTPSSVADRAMHILLVEDHGDTAEAMAALLQAMGHQVTTAGTVAAAVAAAERGKFDLVLSDLGLPDGHGHELMRDLSLRHGLLGIALSGYGMEEDIAKSRESGFAIHLTKPVSLDTLRAALRRIAGSAVEIGDRS